MPPADPSTGTSVPVRHGLFVEGPPPALVCGRCGTCAKVHFPRALLCPYCSADTVDEVHVRGPGTLWAFTAVTAPPPGYAGDVPYGFGVVELPEGVRVVARITESDPAALSLDESMELVVVALHTDELGRSVVTYAFAPGS